MSNDQEYQDWVELVFIANQTLLINELLQKDLISRNNDFVGSFNFKFIDSYKWLLVAPGCENLLPPLIRCAYIKKWGQVWYGSFELGLENIQESPLVLNAYELYLQKIKITF